jgi:hypothetical protein
MGGRRWQTSVYCSILWNIPYCAYDVVVGDILGGGGGGGFGLVFFFVEKVEGIFFKKNLVLNAYGPGAKRGPVKFWHRTVSV